MLSACVCVCVCVCMACYYQLVMCGAFYPNYFEQVSSDEVSADREISGYNPCTTVMVCSLWSSIDCSWAMKCVCCFCTFCAFWPTGDSNSTVRILNIQLHNHVVCPRKTAWLMLHWNYNLCTVEMWLLLPFNYSTYLNVKCRQKLARCDITTVFVVFCTLYIQLPACFSFVSYFANK